MDHCSVREKTEREREKSAARFLKKRRHHPEIILCYPHWRNTRAKRILFLLALPTPGRTSACLLRFLFLNRVTIVTQRKYSHISANAPSSRLVSTLFSHTSSRPRQRHPRLRKLIMTKVYNSVTSSRREKKMQRRAFGNARKRIQ